MHLGNVYGILISRRLIWRNKWRFRSPLRAAWCIDFDGVFDDRRTGRTPAVRTAATVIGADLSSANCSHPTTSPHSLVTTHSLYINEKKTTRVIYRCWPCGLFANLSRRSRLTRVVRSVPLMNSDSFMDFSTAMTTVIIVKTLYTIQFAQSLPIAETGGRTSYVFS